MVWPTIEDHSGATDPASRLAHPSLSRLWASADRCRAMSDPARGALRSAERRLPRSTSSSTRSRAAVRALHPGETTSRASSREVGTTSTNSVAYSATSMASTPSLNRVPGMPGCKHRSVAPYLLRGDRRAWREKSCKAAFVRATQNSMHSTTQDEQHPVRLVTGHATMARHPVSVPRHARGANLPDG